jgi:hypothetical protein
MASPLLYAGAAEMKTPAFSGFFVFQRLSSGFPAADPVPEPGGVRVNLGGVCRIDVARAYGYKDGSTITQMLKRLQAKAKSKPAITRRMTRLETEIDHVLSGVKS